MSSLTCSNCNALFATVGRAKSLSICKPCYNAKTRQEYKEKIEKHRKGIEDGSITHATCKHCEEEKPVSEFTVQLKYCKPCQSKIQSEFIKKESTKKRREEKLMELKTKETLVCVCCKEEKPQSDFTSKSKVCKQCTQIRNIASYKENQEERKAYQKEYTKRRKDEKRMPSITEKRCTECQIVKPVDEFSFSFGKGLQPKCNECRKIEAKKYRENNKEQIKERARERNKDKPRQTRSILTKLRSYVNRCLKGDLPKSFSKAAREHLGCDISFFVEWIKWNCDRDQYSYERLDGSWHIDHVIPCNQFDWEVEAEGNNACFHWTNMIPLDSTKNVSKQDKIILSQIDLVKTRLVEFMQIQGFTEEDIQKHLHHWQTTFHMMISQISKRKTRKDF